MLNKSPFRGRKFLASIGTKGRRYITPRYYRDYPGHLNTEIRDQDGEVIDTDYHGTNADFQRHRIDLETDALISEGHNVEVADKGDKDLPREGTKARRSITPMRPEVNGNRRIVIRDQNGDPTQTWEYEAEDAPIQTQQRETEQMTRDLQSMDHDVEVADKGDKSQPGHSGPGSVVSTRGGAGEQQHGTVSRSLPPILDSNSPVVVNVGGNHVVRGTHQVSEVAPNSTPRRKGVNPKIYGGPHQESEESRASRRASIPEGEEQPTSYSAYHHGAVDMAHTSADMEKNDTKENEREGVFGEPVSITPYHHGEDRPAAARIRGHSLKSIRQTYRKKAHGPYEDGYRARLASKPKEENPHTEELQQDDSTSHGFAWDNGWDTAHQDLSREDEKDEPFGYGQRRKLRRDQKKSVPGHFGIGSEVIIPEERARGRVVHVGDQNDENRMANVRIRRPGHGSPIRSVYDEDVAEVAPRRNQASLKSVPGHSGIGSRVNVSRHGSPIQEGVVSRPSLALPGQMIVDEPAGGWDIVREDDVSEIAPNHIPRESDVRAREESERAEMLKPKKRPKQNLSQQGPEGLTQSHKAQRGEFTRRDPLLEGEGRIAMINRMRDEVARNNETHDRYYGLRDLPRDISSGTSPRGIDHSRDDEYVPPDPKSLSYLDSTAGGSLVPHPAFGRGRTQRRWIKKGIKGGPIGPGQRVITRGNNVDPMEESPTVSGMDEGADIFEGPTYRIISTSPATVVTRHISEITPEPTRTKKPRVPKGRSQRQGNYHQERQNYPEAGNKAIEDMHSELAESGKRTDERAQRQLNYGRHAANTHGGAPQAQSMDEYNERVQNYEKPLNEMQREISRGEQEESQIRERHAGDYLIHGKKIKAHHVIRTDAEDTPHGRYYVTHTQDANENNTYGPMYDMSREDQENRVRRIREQQEDYDDTSEVNDQAKGKSIEPNETLNSLKNKLAKGETLTGDEICEFPNLLKKEDGNFAADLLKKVIKTMNVSKGSETSKAAYIKQLIEHASSDVGKKGIKAAHVPGQPIKKGSKVRITLPDNSERGTYVDESSGNGEFTIRGGLQAGGSRDPNNIARSPSNIARSDIALENQVTDVEPEAEADERMKKPEHGYRMEYREGEKSMNNGLKPEELQLLTVAILKAKMDGDDKAVEYLAGLANNPEELRKVTVGMDQPRNDEKSIGIKRIGPSPFRGRKGIQEPKYTQRRGARVSVDVYGNRVPAYVLGQNHEAGTTDVVTNEEPNLTVPHGQIIGQEPWQANWGRDDKKRRVREEQGNVD